MTTANEQRWVVGSDDVSENIRDVRLDAWLADHLAVSRAEAKRLLARGQVRVNGRSAFAEDKGSLLKPGDTVGVRDFVAPSLQLPIAQPELVVPVLSEGEGWVVFDKPAGMPVHPLSPDERGTLLNYAIARHPQLAGVGEGSLRSGVVHRLDVETSGCLVIATNQDMWQTLTAAFQGHTTTKLYHAWVAGHLTGEGRDEVRLYVAQHHPARVRVLAADDGAHAKDTRLCHHTWRVLQLLPGATLVEISLGTGFLHQIRATFAHRGHPVLGDAIYGDKCSAPRLMLHACLLTAGTAHGISPQPRDFEPRGASPAAK